MQSIFKRTTVPLRSVEPSRRWNNNSNRRSYYSNEFSQSTSFKTTVVAIAVATTVAVALSKETLADTKIDYDAVRKDIEAVLDAPNYDDGSYAPILLRLAWHAAGTYDKNTKTGGADGATMRFTPESAHGANAGLAVARDLLDPIKKKYPELSHADLWSLAGVVAVESMGGPKINWRPGRSDKPDGTYCPPDGRLPDASKGPSHVRDIFSRMGFSDREIVALVGAHAVGRCHTNRSGYTGPWTNSPIVFSNDYFVQLANNKWTKKKWEGPEQFEDPSGQLMMLPADLALLEDPEFKKYVNIYASDQDAFFKDFSVAFQKLVELGVHFPAHKPWWKIW